MDKEEKIFWRIAVAMLLVSAVLAAGAVWKMRGENRLAAEVSACRVVVAHMAKLPPVFDYKLDLPATNILTVTVQLTYQVPGRGAGVSWCVLSHAEKGVAPQLRALNIEGREVDAQTIAIVQGFANIDHIAHRR